MYVNSPSTHTHTHTALPKPEKKKESDPGLALGTWQHPSLAVDLTVF